jgi:hypothetical protein
MPGKEGVCSPSRSDVLIDYLATGNCRHILLNSTGYALANYFIFVGNDDKDDNIVNNEYSAY